jgi:hypothetical protein
MYRVSVILNRKLDPSAPSPAHFYRLVEEGRIKLLHVGRASYSEEDWPAIVRRINAEDSKSGKKAGASRPMPQAVKEQLTASHRRAG